MVHPLQSYTFDRDQIDDEAYLGDEIRAFIQDP